MKLAAKKKGRKATFFKLYTKELEGIFFISLITMGIALLLKGIFFTLQILSLRATHQDDGISRSIKELVANKSLNIDNFYALMVAGFIICIIVSIVLTAFMSFYIFLKEWFGRKKTIYTLMTLPVKKINIIGSKFLAVITYFLTLLGVSILELIIEYNISNMLVGTGMLSFKDFIISSRDFVVILSDTRFLIVLLLLVMAGIAFSFLLVMFNRTNAIWGSVIAVLLAGALLGLMFFGLVQSSYLFTYELLPIVYIFSITVIIISILGSNLLFVKKVHV